MCEASGLVLLDSLHWISDHDADMFVNCAVGVSGDSRAVLSRGDVAIPLTDDHKAAREDETVRTVRDWIHAALFCISMVYPHMIMRHHNRPRDLASAA